VKGTITKIDEYSVTVKGEDDEEYLAFPGDLRTTRKAKITQKKSKAKTNPSTEKLEVITVEASIEEVEPPSLSKRELKELQRQKQQQNKTKQYIFLVGETWLNVGDEVSFLCSGDDTITWLTKGDVEPPPPSIDELLAEYLDTGELGEFDELEPKITCPKNIHWHCPWCDLTQHFEPGSKAPCERCSCEFPDGGEFKRRWVMEETFEVHAQLTFQPLKWECPHCQWRQVWYAAPGKPAPARCNQCNEPRPKSHGIAYRETLDHEDYCYCYEPTGVSVITTVDLERLVSEGEHLSVKDILDQGDRDFAVSELEYKDKACPFCTPKGSSRKGCQHGSLINATPLRFSAWYGLVESDVRYAPRVAQLHRLLAGIPPCICVNLHGGIGAIPKAPYNVFRDLEEDIDPNDTYWENTCSGIVTEKRPKLSTGYEVITGANEGMKCHIVPRSAGGCYLNVLNVIWIQHLCPTCQCLDALFTCWQGENANIDDDAYAIRWTCSEEQLEELKKSPKQIEEILNSRKERDEKIDSMIKLFEKK
jgi:hypothetical protein